MTQDRLSRYFTGVAAKRLSAVEADVLRSNQHEVNGVESLKRLFGSASGRQQFPARFIYLTDSADDAVVSDGFLTWYDARERHPTRSERRLYFPTTSVSKRATEGDLLVIGRRPDGSALVVIAARDSTVANQVQWLFGLANLERPGYSVRDELASDRDRIAFASRLILESIGITVEPPPDTHLDDMLRQFGGEFPSTQEFSTYARSTVREEFPADGQDAALMAWMDREEVLFRTLERHLITGRLSRGFRNDVDGFIAFSLSVQNRRKSRVGYALENHLEHIFKLAGIRFARAKVTENRSRPDFLFPGVAEYKDPAFCPRHLTMLGVKASCKDRWRQVLAEADRIKNKHLLTLESAISVNQTDEMRAKRLRLVVPRQIHATYAPPQREWLMDVATFSTLVRQRQVNLA